MEFLTATLLSGIAYDLIKSGAIITADRVKEKISNWIVDDTLVKAIAEELQRLKLNDEVSEKYIERKINESEALLELIKKINSTSSSAITTNINQQHSGTGDNIGRDKISR